MRNPPVHWYEGLFLRPQHFQAADRFWEELQATSRSYDAPYGYGLHTLEISHAALENNQFEVQALRARMPDGTLVDLQVGEEPDRVDLRAAVHDVGRSVDLAEPFDAAAVVRVYLAVPKLRLGQANVGGSGVGDRERRYSTAVVPVQDETQGGDEQEIEFRHLNVRLLLSTQNLSGYEVLPIAQIKRGSDERPVPHLDSAFVPPLLRIDAWPSLVREYVRAAYDVVGQKSEVLGQQLVNRGVGFDSRHPGDLDRMLMLSELNSVYAVLGVKAFCSGTHPLEAYTELCRAVGRLSVFAGTRRVPELPRYDHDDLARIFHTVYAELDRLLNSVLDYEFEQRYFEGVGLGMQVSLEAKWFNSDWEWYIGVRKGDLSTDECRRLLSPGHLDWKFGSARQVETLFTQRAEGLSLKPLDRAVRSLPAGDDWLFYEVSKKDNPAWRDVQQTQTLAVRLKDSLILNSDRLQGNRTLVVSSDGRDASLQFSLFAVPNRT